VEAAEKGDDAVTLGVIARQLDGRLDRFGSRVREERSLCSAKGRNRLHCLPKTHLRLVIKVRARHVQELLCLVNDRGDDVRM
jgi:hypothetical protein